MVAYHLPSQLELPDLPEASPAAHQETQRAQPHGEKGETNAPPVNNPTPMDNPQLFSHIGVRA